MIARRYLNTPHDDVLLAEWFRTLHSTGDWDKLFRTPQGGIGWFYTYFQRDVQLWLVENDAQNALIAAGWFEPLKNGGAFFSLWIHPTHRPSRTTFVAYGELLDYGIERTGFILGMTKQEKLLDAHRKMGYTIHGPIEGLWPGERVWLMTLNREQLEEGSYGQYLRRRRQERGTGHARLRRAGQAGQDRVGDGSPTPATSG